MKKTEQKEKWDSPALEGLQEDFTTLFNPVYHFAESTPQRVPVSDWYITDNAYMVGFQARSVVGRYFIKMLADPATWKKWNALGGGIN